MGKIVEATASSNEKKLNEILDSDEGARYVGEFAIGFNPMIREPMLDILFDEKIAGSFHFTPAKPMRTQIMEISLRFIGIWSVFNALNGAEERFDLMANSSARMGDFCPMICRALTLIDCSVNFDDGFIH